MKSVSIAMATYNGARFISEQLESLAHQTILPDELVITDDASTDDTIEIITAFATDAPFPVRIEKNIDRLGYRDNFMKAAELCKSELIAFCDQDDVWMSNKLEACLLAFENKDVLLAYHNAIITTEKLEHIGLMNFSAPPQTMNPAMSLEPWKNGGWGFTTVIDRFLLNFGDLWLTSVDVYETREKEKHDQWFLFLASYLGTVAYIDKPLALYRQHNNNAVGHRGAPTMQGKLDILLKNDLEAIKSRAIAAGSRARILEGMHDELSTPYRDRASTAAAGYRKLEAIYRGRQEIYCAKDVFLRVGRLISLSRFGGYRPRTQWGVGRQALLRDIVRGVFSPSESSKARLPEKQ